MPTRLFILAAMSSRAIKCARKYGHIPYVVRIEYCLEQAVGKEYQVIKFTAYHPPTYLKWETRQGVQHVGECVVILTPKVAQDTNRMKFYA